MSNLNVLGLMAIAPLAEPDAPRGDSRPYFAQARIAFDALPASQQQILSMGMSGDYADAIAEGSTMVRIGTSLFGARPPRDSS